MRSRASLIIAVFLLSMILVSPVFPAAFDSFLGQISSDGINVRADSTTSSDIVCVLNRGDKVLVVAEKYDWCRIVMPKACPSFIKKDFVLSIDDKSGKVSASRVNVRMKPDESSVILGKADNGEIINIIGESGSWYRIEPINNSFAWVNKKFVQKAPETNKLYPVQENTPAGKNGLQPAGQSVFVGVIEPYGKVIRRKATHKLVCIDKIFLLKGNADNLNSLAYHTVKVTGKVLPDKQDKFPIIEISKLELLN